ncbi:TPA: hypothetical protein DDW35_01615, partial [Candidatus Sumerlaeota bacterium]|nr:hypothetical protein [Candidatus Sumerlaeota bacterium]
MYFWLEKFSMKPDISPNENVSTARFNNWRTLLPQSIDVWLLCVALLIPLAMCVAKLNLDLWHDEAYTLMYFVSGGLRQIATDYNCANNHLFYLMALYPFFEFSNATVILRAPSLFFAVGTLFFVYRTLKRNVSAGAGVLGVLWLGLNQMFLGHVMQLRGYGFSLSFITV